MAMQGKIEMLAKRFGADQSASGLVRVPE